MRISRNISLLVLLVAGVLIAFLSYNTVWLGDDINYAYRFSLEEQKYPIESISDIIASQNVHYVMANGRYLAHCIVQLFCGILGHGSFAVCNGLVYICFILIFCKVAGMDWHDWKSVLGAAVLVLLSFQTKMVPSCQIGFVWMFTLSLCWLYIFFKENRTIVNPLLLFTAFVASVIIGNGQEALNIGICGALVILWINRKFKFSALQYCLAIGFGMGTLIDCLSPGTIGRSDASGGSIVAKAVSIMNLFFYGRAIWLMLAVVLYQGLCKHISWSKIYKDSAFFWNVWIVLILFNWAIGFPSNRAMFGIELMSLIIMFRTLPKRQISAFWLTTLGLCCIVVYIIQGEQVLRHKSFYNSVEKAWLDSADGIVYADFDNSSIIPECNRFIGGYKAFVYACIEDYESDMLDRKLKTKYGDRDRLRVLPLAMKDYAVENRVVRLTDGYWLAIQNKSNPDDFVIRRKIGWKSVAPLPVDFSSPTYEDDNLRAKIILDSEYKIMNISSVTVEAESCTNE